MKKIFAIFPLFVLLTMTLVSCSPKNVTIDMELTEYKFNPDTIEVSAGSEVTVNFTNKGTLEHEMVIMVLGKNATAPFDADDEPNIFWEHELESGDQESVTFTSPTEPGEYQIVCGIPAHLELGMVGTLIVK